MELWYIVIGENRWPSAAWQETAMCAAACALTVACLLFFLLWLTSRWILSKFSLSRVDWPFALSFTVSGPQHSNRNGTGLHWISFGKRSEVIVLPNGRKRVDRPNCKRGRRCELDLEYTRMVTYYYGLCTNSCAVVSTGIISGPKMQLQGKLQNNLTTCDFLIFLIIKCVCVYFLFLYSRTKCTFWI